MKSIKMTDIQFATIDERATDHYNTPDYHLPNLDRVDIIEQTEWDAIAEYIPVVN